MFRKKSLITLCGVLLVGAGIYFVLQQRTSAPAIRHVILISMDTTRADHLGCYGFSKPTTPNIDALAEQGFLFKNAMTPIPLTLPAHTSMLTGTIPPHHGKRENGDAYMSPHLVTLASVLKQKNYSTGAFIAAQVLNANFGLDRGFDIYHDQFDNPANHKRSGEEVNRVAFSWLEQQKENPVFLFMHYYDPHAMYLPPEPFATRFKDDLYAGEIAYTDHCIGQLIAKLKALDMFESSLIIVTADHGEMLGEHGEETHGYFIYQGSMKVPMVFKLPGPNSAQSIDDIASIIDIVPTVCDLLDIAPPADIEGKNLAGYFGDNPPPPEDRYLYCESLRPTTYGANALRGLASTKWKYINTTRPELYDLENDPDEQKDLIGEHSRLVSILDENLSQISELAAHYGSEKQAAPIAPDLVRHLQSLGYIGEISVEEDVSFDETLDDPKDLVEFHNAWVEASHSWANNELDQALTALHGVIDRRPVYAFCDLATRIYLSRKDYKNAVVYGEKTVAARPGSFTAHEQLAFAYSFAEQFDLAAQHFELTLKLLPPDLPDLKPKSARLYFQLGMTNVKLEKFDLAIAQFEHSLSLNTEEPSLIKPPLVLNALAAALLDSPAPLRDPPRALELAKQACNMTQMSQPVFLQTLAQAYAEIDNFEEAAQVTGFALKLAEGARDGELAAELQKQLEQYQRKAMAPR